MTHAPTPPAPTTILHSHRFQAFAPGPRLIVLGAVHGNETCGTRAIQRTVAALEAGELVLQRGRLTLVPVTNPLAYNKQQRNGDRNLNRNLAPSDAPQDFEDRIANALCPLLAAHDVLLDLHSFQSTGEPFVMLGPVDNTGALEPFAHAAQEQALALRLGPRRIVEGWLGTYAVGVQRRLARTAPTERAQLLSTDPRYGVGTTEYMRSTGGYALTLECGQHQDPQAPEVAWQAILRTLAHLQMVDAPAPDATTGVEFLRLTEVVDKLHASDSFSRAWSSYDAVVAGQNIGTRHDGTPVVASASGFIVFPNASAVAGNEWFYFAQGSGRALGT